MSRSSEVRAVDGIFITINFEELFLKVIFSRIPIMHFCHLAASCLFFSFNKGRGWSKNYLSQ